MPMHIHDKIHNETQRLLDLLGMKTGAYNFDVRIDKDENVILMELGPRNGGNLIAQVIEYATGVDTVKYTIESAMGKDCSDLKMVEPNGFWSCFMVHSKKAGILKSVEFSHEVKKNNIVEFEMMYNKGDKVDSFNGSNGTLGTMILKYSSMDEMLTKMDNMDDFVKVMVE